MGDEYDPLRGRERYEAFNDTMQIAVDYRPRWFDNGEPPSEPPVVTNELCVAIVLELQEIRRLLEALMERRR